MGAIDDPGLLQRHLLTVDDYYRMAEVGVLAPDARVELIEGEIIEMAPQRSRHASTVAWFDRQLQLAVGDEGWVYCQLPLRLSSRSEPEPDLMLLRPRADNYASAHPGAADVVLLIEVADSSARYDREIKLPLYARHGVAEVWIVDLTAGLLRMHRTPDAEGYLDSSASKTPGVVALPGIVGARLDLSGLFQPA